MRKLGMLLRVAFASMVAHKRRAFLTMLGIIIGVAAVIALVAVGQGSQQQVLSRFQSLGSNLLTVSSTQNFGFSREGARSSSRPLTTRDVDAIRGLASSIKYVAP